MRNLICLLILIAVVVAVQYGLRQLSHSVDLVSFLAICGAIVAAQWALASVYDRYH